MSFNIIYVRSLFVMGCFLYHDSLSKWFWVWYNNSGINIIIVKLVIVIMWFQFLLSDKGELFYHGGCLITAIRAMQIFILYLSRQIYL